jgi:hypothetical protein
MKGERTPRNMHEAFPKDYHPVLNTGPSARFGGLFLLIVALIGAALYFWS